MLATWLKMVNFPDRGKIKRQATWRPPFEFVSSLTTSVVLCKPDPFCVPRSRIAYNFFWKNYVFPKFFRKIKFSKFNIIFWTLNVYILEILTRTVTSSQNEWNHRDEITSIGNIIKNIIITEWWQIVTILIVVIIL